MLAAYLLLLALAGTAVVVLVTASSTAWAGIVLLVLAVVTFLWNFEPEAMFEDAWVESAKFA